ncbi:MAG: hypothetical protein IJ802_02880, partial [Kiritimatiellae bacterium]|nr:hypothetical protein [Kiritimatiellia bacterium]
MKRHIHILLVCTLQFAVCGLPLPGAVLSNDPSISLSGNALAADTLPAHFRLSFNATIPAGECTIFSFAPENASVALSRNASGALSLDWADDLNSASLDAGSLAPGRHAFEIEYASAASDILRGTTVRIDGTEHRFSNIRWAGRAIETMTFGEAAGMAVGNVALLNADELAAAPHATTTSTIASWQ